MDYYQVCSNNVPGAKTGPPLGSHKLILLLHIDRVSDSGPLWPSCLIIFSKLMLIFFFFYRNPHLGLITRLPLAWWRHWNIILRGATRLWLTFVFLLQEPTSGLDYKTAFSLVKTLKHYTEGRNKTVVDICFLVTGTHIWARLQDCL